MPWRDRISAQMRASAILPTAAAAWLSSSRSSPPGGALQPSDLRLDLVRRHRVGLVEGEDFGLGGEHRPIGIELGAHGLVGLARMLAGSVDQMQQDPAAFHVAEEAVAEAGALMG